MDRLSFGLYSLLTAFARLLPIGLCCRFGALLGIFGYLALGRYRRLAAHNLRIAFPEASRREVRKLARKHFATLGANLLSSLKIAHLSREQISQIVTIEGQEIVNRLEAANRGIVMIISHIGNWELFAQLWPVTFQCPGGTVYQRLGNPFIDAAVRQNRARLGIQLFERKEGFQGAMQLLRKGGCVGVLVDQHAGDAGVWCPFFNRLASTSSLAATLGLRTGAALLPGAVYSDGTGRWRLVIQEPIEPGSHDASEVTAQINQTLERQIRAQPADWFWVHNRWKTPNPKFLLATYKRGIAGSCSGLQPFRILVRTSNWLGDAVMSVPAVQAIKRGRPDAHVTVLTPAKLADFWRSIAEVDEIISIPGSQSVFGVAWKIRGRFEAAIIFPNSFRTGLEVFLAGIPRRVGYPGHRRAALLNQVLRRKKRKQVIATAPRHQVHHYLALAKFVGAEIEGAVVLPSRAPMNDAPSGTLGELPVSDRQPVFGLCAGAEYGAAKRWLPERFAEVMTTMAQRTNCQWKLFGVAKDRPIIDSILSSTRVKGLDLVGKTSLAQLIEHLRSCDLLLSNDTGTMHLAASLGIPVVALFGSTEPSLTGPLGSGHQILRRHVECSPCFLRDCPIDFRCMHALTVSDVVAAIERLQATQTATRLPSGFQPTPNPAE